VAISLLFADEIMTNSSWTSAHVTSLLTLGRSTWLAYLLNLDGSAQVGKRVAPNRTVFPPCGTSEFDNLPLKGRDDRPRTLISLAQFRPEKDQAKQIRAVAELFERVPKWREEGVKLVLMGSCRDEADEERIEGLKRLAKELRVEVSCGLVLNSLLIVECDG
jgi:alpha-1,2-mannosyltransferase